MMNLNVKDSERIFEKQKIAKENALIVKTYVWFGNSIESYCVIFTW